MVLDFIVNSLVLGELEKSLMSLNESEEEHVEIPSEGTDVWEIDPVIKVIGYCTCLSFSLYIYLLITHLV